VAPIAVLVREESLSVALREASPDNEAQRRQLEHSQQLKISFKCNTLPLVLTVVVRWGATSSM